MELWDLEEAIVAELKQDPRCDVDTERIIVGLRGSNLSGGGAVAVDTLVEGGVMVQYTDSSIGKTLTNGTVLDRSPRITIAVGATRDDPSRVHKLISGVIAVLNGHSFEGVTLRYDGDRFRGELNGVFWFNVMFRTNCILGI